MQTEQPLEKHGKTGYSVIRVKETTKARFDQLMDETQTQTGDELLSLLIEHYTAKNTADQQKPEI